MLVAAGDEDEHAFLAAAFGPRARHPSLGSPLLRWNDMPTTRQFPKRASERLVTEVRREIVVSAGRGGAFR